jgi:hypothetical protein
MRDIGAAGAATIVRLRRLLACGGRPHTFTVRFRMHQKPVFLLATLVTLGSNPLLAQPEQAVDIHISGETCLIGNLDVPCSDVGAKLRELGTPLNAHLHLIGDTRTSYKATSAAMESLRRAGFKLKMGYMNVQPQ